MLAEAAPILLPGGLQPIGANMSSPALTKEMQTR